MPRAVIRCRGLGNCIKDFLRVEDDADVLKQFYHVRRLSPALALILLFFVLLVSNSCVEPLWKAMPETQTPRRQTKPIYRALRI